MTLSTTHRLVVIVSAMTLLCGTRLHAMDLQKQNVQTQWIEELSKINHNLTTIRSLAERGADVNVPGTVTTGLNVFDKTLLAYVPHTYPVYAIVVAAKRNDWDLLTLLLSKGARPNVKSEWPADNEEMPLHFAVAKGAIQAVQELVKVEAGIDAVCGDFHWTPLRMAMHHRYNKDGHYVGLQEIDKQIITLLLRAGANTYITDISGQSDASYAQEYDIDLSALR